MIARDSVFFELVVILIRMIQHKKKRPKLVNFFTTSPSIEIMRYVALVLESGGAARNVSNLCDKQKSVNGSITCVLFMLLECLAQLCMCKEAAEHHQDNEKESRRISCVNAQKCHSDVSDANGDWQRRDHEVLRPALSSI